MKNRVQRKTKQGFMVLMLLVFTSCADLVYYEDQWRVEENSFPSYTPVPDQKVSLSATWESTLPVLEKDLEVSFKVPQEGTLSQENKFTDFCKFNGSFALSTSPERTVTSTCTTPLVGYYVYELKNTGSKTLTVNLRFELFEVDGENEFTHEATRTVQIYANQTLNIGYDFD